MDVVTLITHTQREFLVRVEQLGGSVPAALGLSEISDRLLTEWQTDADFRLALDNAKASGKGVLEAAAMTGLMTNLNAGKMEAVKLTLQSVDPGTWNPAQRIEWEPPQHRFIGFDGRDLITGELDDAGIPPPEAESEEATEAETEAEEAEVLNGD